MKEPILATRTVPRRRNGYPKVPMTFTVHGGLHYLRGNASPYFALTLDSHRKGFPDQCQSGGCDHETILKSWPRFADLAALHMSSIDGVPMHAEANAWYNLAGALPDFAGEQFHVGNTQQHFPKLHIDPAKPWDKTDYRNPTPDEALGLFAKYVRIDSVTAAAVRQSVIDAAMREDLTFNWDDGRRWFDQWIEEQHPRWKAEADACIAKHNLVVFGDKWEAPL